MAVAMAVSMAGCGGSPSESKDSTKKTETADSTASTGGSVENKDKPLCWFNRQPSSSATGELDKDALNFNGNTYYVGFDANQGAELQGQMVLDYIKKNADTIDRNGDGVIGYVLAIGDIGHNDSIARTRGVRSALGTGVDADGGVDSTPAGTNVDGKAKVVQDATLDVDGKTYTIGVLVQSNFGATRDLKISGKPAGEKILERIRKEECGSSAEDRGSIMTVLATDLPVSERQLYRIIRRCGVGIARTGAYTGHGSGEIMIGFTTANRVDTKSTCEVEACARIKEEKINEAFEAAAEAVEEAILNSMVTAREKRGLDGARYRSLAEFLEIPGFPE